MQIIDIRMAGILNKEVKMGSKRIISILGKDRQLLTILSGIVCSGLALVALVIAVGIWYL